MSSIRHVNRVLKTHGLSKGERSTLTAYGKTLMRDYDKMHFMARGKSAPWVKEVHKTVVTPFDKKAEKYIRKAERMVTTCRHLTGRKRAELMRKARKHLMTARSIIKDHVAKFNAHLQRTNAFVGRNAGRAGYNGDMDGNTLKRPLKNGKAAAGKLSGLLHDLARDGQDIRRLK